MQFSFHTFFKTAPPTLVLLPDVPTFTIISANAAFLEATNAGLEELAGRSLSDAFPENPSGPVKNVQALTNSLIEVIRTKKQNTLPDQRYDIPLWGTGRFRTRYLRICNSPIINDTGEVDYLILSFTDISAGVAAVMKERFVLEVSEERRRGIQQVEERLRLAIDSAEMGTWWMDADTREFKPSPRMKVLFGYLPEEDMCYEAVIAQISPEYRQMAAQAVDAALAGGASFNIEYPVIGYRDQKARWLRATGKRYEANAGSATHFSGTIIDITDRKHEELRKNDFLSIASHELKTPLTSLKASLQVLARMKDNPAPAMLPKLIDQSNKSMDKITSLVNDLLNIGRITDGKMELNESDFNIAEMIGKCCDHLRIAGTHEIIFEGDPELKVRGDEPHIDQVLVNLVNNAVKYAPGSSKIIIRVERFYPLAKISVQDFGPGIPKNHLDQLFKRYYRADTSSVQNTGLGLGLYISAEIVEKHGGEMGVSSEPGQGSTFWFTLPLADRTGQ